MAGSCNGIAPDCTRTYTVKLLPLASVGDSVRWLQMYYECTYKEAVEMYRAMKNGDIISLETNLWWTNESPVRTFERAPRHCFAVEHSGY